MPKTIDSRIMSVILKMSYVRSLHRVICLVLRIEPRLLQYSKCSGSRDKLTLEFMHDFLVVVTTFWEKIVPRESPSSHRQDFSGTLLLWPRPRGVANVGRLLVPWRSPVSTLAEASKGRSTGTGKMRWMHSDTPPRNNIPAKILANRAKLVHRTDIR